MAYKHNELAGSVHRSTLCHIPHGGDLVWLPSALRSACIDGEYPSDVTAAWRPMISTFINYSDTSFLAVTLARNLFTIAEFHVSASYAFPYVCHAVPYRDLGSQTCDQ